MEQEIFLYAQRALATLLLGTWLLAPAPTLARAWVLRPEPSNPARTLGDASSIQAALGDARDGDTIDLEPGTYQVNLTFPQEAITLRGLGENQEDVILDGSACVPEETDNWCSVLVFNWFDDGGELPEDATAAVENLTITGGTGSGYWAESAGVFPHSEGSFNGGGVWMAYANPKVINVALSANSATYVGGGMALYNSSPLLEHVSVVDNHSEHGGGMYLSSSNPMMSQVEFEQNSAMGGHGGGIYLLSSSPGMIDTEFFLNRAYGEGGGLYLSSSYPDLRGVLVRENTASDGGGIVMRSSSNATLSDCAIEGNTSTDRGGGLYVIDSSPTLQNSTLLGNSASIHGGGIYMMTSSSQVIQVRIGSNHAGARGGGMYVDSSSPKFRDSDIVGNVASENGGGMTLASSNPLMTGVVIKENLADYGAGVYLGDSSPTLSQCIISQNVSRFGGGGMFSTISEPVLIHVSLTGNVAASGGALYLSNSSPVLKNAILTHNDGVPANILWHDQEEDDILTLMSVLFYSPQEGEDDLTQVSGYDVPSSVLVADPLFVDPDGGDLRLLKGSPALDSGALEGCLDEESGELDGPCVDPDGSPPDLGAFGGAGLDGWDGDEDGYPYLMWWPEDDDGAPSVQNGYDARVDCDDTNPDIHPGAAEIPYDGVDQDCDGSDLTDVDGDGFSGGGGGSDCDDSDPSAQPGAEEIPYDGIDQGCDGGDVTDMDGDGFSGGEGGGDCDDTNRYIHPGAAEIPYDGVDQDCDGDDLTDVDGDGFDGGDGSDCDDSNSEVYPGAEDTPGDGVDQDCSEGVRTDDDDDGALAESAGGGDCDDLDPSVHPGADEIPYDGIDQDCDGADLGCNPEGQECEEVHPNDGDEDGYPGGTSGDDCDDSNPDVHPEAPEVCGDGVDNDCDGDTEDTCGRSVACASSGQDASVGAAFWLILAAALRRRRSLGSALALPLLSCSPGPSSPALVPGRALASAPAAALPLEVDTLEGPRYSGRFALLIGNSNYEEGSGWRDLRGVEAEITQLAAALEGVGFSVEVARDLDRDSTRRAVEQFLRRHGDESSHQLLLFYAGHGYSLPTPGRQGVAAMEGYLVPADAPSPVERPDDFRYEAIRVSEVKSWLAPSRAHHMLLIFDSCFAGTFFTDMRSAGAGRLAEPARHVITAGDFQQEVPDQSIFGDKLVEALSRPELADILPDGLLTCRELGTWLATSVPRSGLTAQQPQSGPLSDPAFQYGDCLVASYSPTGLACGSVDSCLGAMRVALAETQALDEGRRGAPELRVRGWEAYLASWEPDLPGDEDDQMRREARRHLAGAQEDLRTGGVKWCQVGSVWVTCSNISVAQYHRCQEEGACPALPPQAERPGCHPSGGDGRDWPATCVSLEGALRYAEWLGGLLPSGEEWLSAAGPLPERCLDAAFSLDGVVGPSAWGCGRGGPPPSLGAEGAAPTLMPLWGGVWEWLAPSPGGGARIAGGAWDIPLGQVAGAPVREVAPSLTLETVGLRVVRDTP